jgi:TonB family protein
MRERISKAKAFIAVKNYNAAIYELENIRRETGDQTVHGVINVLLMNSYLEQGDYTRAQAFLKELSSPSKNGKPVQTAHYFSVAGQVVKGARSQVERYRSLGLTISDRNLPLEAAVDLEKMRETLELVVEQSKTIGADKSKSADAMALLEEATTTRVNLAKDDYDAKRWKDAVSDAREQLTSSRSVVNAVTEAPPVETAAVSPNIIASTNPAGVTEPATVKPNDSATLFKPVSNDTAADQPNTPGASNNKPAPDPVAANIGAANNVEAKKETAKEQSKTPSLNSENVAATPNRTRRVENKEAETKPESKPDNSPEKANDTTAATSNENAADASPLNVGSLVSYATAQAKPVYPIAAKNMRMTGVVKVEVLVNENGEVSEVQTATGPSMLQRAATDAVKKWKFKPFVRAGQPVKASGFVSFNFSL